MKRPELGSGPSAWHRGVGSRNTLGGEARTQKHLSTG